MNNELHRRLRDPIFKGCTRPAMKFGVPLGPLIGVFMACTLCGLWTSALVKSLAPGLLAGALFLILLVTMRSIAKKDDQRFRQMGLAFRLHIANSLKRVFGAITYSPYRYKRRR